MKIAVRVAVSVIVLALLLTLLPFDEIKQAVGGLSPLLWLGVLLGFLVGHRAGVEKWRSLVNAGRAALGSRQAVRCYAAGLFANLCLPSIVGGDVLRAALASRVTGRTEAVVIGALADRLLDVMALATLITIGALAAPTLLPGAASWLVAGLVFGGAATAVIAVTIAGRRPLSSWSPRFRRRIGRTLVGLRRLRRYPRVTAGAFTISLGIQSGFVLLNAAVGRAVGIDVPVIAWFLVWPLAKVAALLPISLGGLGLRDATLGALLVPLGVPMALGVVASLVWQSVLIAGGLIAGGLWMLLGREGAAGARQELRRLRRSVGSEGRRGHA